MDSSKPDTMFSTMKGAAMSFFGNRKTQFDNVYKEGDDMYKKDIVRLSGLFLFYSDSMDDRVNILGTLGHIAYTGGPEASQFCNHLLPHILIMLEERVADRKMLLQILRFLSQLCYRNSAAVEMIRGRPKVLRKLCDLVGDVIHVLECRWTCYLLSIMVANNNLFMCDLMIKRLPELRANLELASNFPMSWEGWGDNLALQLLKLLGWRVKSYRRTSVC